MKKLFRETKGYVALLLAVLVGVVWLLVLGSLPAGKSSDVVRVVVRQGAGGKEIARLLHDRGLIRSPFVFGLTCALSGSSARLKPGVYEFSESMSLPQVIRRLVRGETLQSWVTVPEGYTIRQIADALEAKQLVNAQEFLSTALERGQEFRDYPFVYGSSLEGYLFPDTYLIDRSVGAEAIASKMLSAFDRKVLAPQRDRMEHVIKRRFGLSAGSFNAGLHKLLTLASLVEREAKTQKDRPLIAAVLWNRLKKNMRLEVDASLSYRPGESRENPNVVYKDDLNSDSAYNTYRNYGLPPGPICNPGAAAIEAVLNPANVDYLYYVAKPDGTHVFSRTFDEHVKAKRAIAGGQR